MFPLLGDGTTRLCAGACERRPPYALVTARLAKSVHALRDRDLARLRSARTPDGARCYLLADVEALSAGRETASRLRARSSAEWRAGSFKTVGGKTHKWKDRNAATFQRGRANDKYFGEAADDANRDCMDLSALVLACL